MKQVSHRRQTRILQASLAPEEVRNRKKQRDRLAMRCRAIFERLHPTLIETHYNWHIAIDPETQQYLIDPTLLGIMQKIHDTYGNINKVKVTIFRLNDTGTCGSL
ncbi:MAG: hypothetical protein KME52_12860 [Desmonostoc geniculatum HA4340-LM1]|jgi:hypothetical protein|nr:hypothetical protein [Desmonostoc geniculatum HA4340-LM1]